MGLELREEGVLGDEAEKVGGRWTYSAVKKALDLSGKERPGFQG